MVPSEEDEGYFECVTENEAGEERRVIEVILQGYPTLLTSLSNQSQSALLSVTQQPITTSLTVHHSADALSIQRVTLSNCELHVAVLTMF